jgi:HAD superfamily hydrolase (TIGR01549 family)
VWERRTDVLRVVSFDVVGTLIDCSYETHVWNEAIPHLYARKRGISFEEAKAYVSREYDRIGNRDIRWYLPEYWFKHFALDEDPGDVFRSHAGKVKFYPEVASVLRDLGRKYELIVASGATRSVIEIMVGRVRHYFKQIYSPVSDRREVKKTPQFYEMICRVLRIEPGCMVHVGDEWYSDFTAPRRIGIRSFYLDRTGEKKGKSVIRDLVELEGRVSSLEEVPTRS